MCRKFISKGILTAVAVSVILSGMVLGCKQATGSDSPSVETIKWAKGSDNYYQYKTNDAQFCGTYAAMTFDTAPSATDTLTIKCKKVSGYDNSGLGMVCFRGSDWDNFYEIEVTPTGYYGVWKKVGGKWSTVIDWSDIAKDIINKGVGAENSITLYPRGSDLYGIKINDYIVDGFTRADSSCPSTGFYGFYASISTAEKEQFPGTPEDMRFLPVK